MTSLRYLWLLMAFSLFACNAKKVKLVSTAVMRDFPSGSSIEIFDNKLIIIGDDANRILILNTAYQRLDSIYLDTITKGRIAKNIKPDYESSALINYNNTTTLVAFGSGSTNLRKSALFLPLPPKGKSVVGTKNISGLYNRFIAAGIKDLNIEGAALVNEQIILANRANLSQPVNTLIIFSPDAFYDYIHTQIKTCKIILPETKMVAGISGLFYLQSKDILLFTASTEATQNTYDDGTIGESYIGIIKNANAALKKNEVQVSSLLHLSTIDGRFRQQKIESLVVENDAGENMIIHLVADNDDGTTKLFKIKMNIE